MKRSLPFLALAVAALLAPAAALAAPAPAVAPVSRSFEIRALILGGSRVAVSGKLWFDSTNLGASVGCNSIGAQVSVDGNVVTIVGPAMMTEMACPGFDGDAEALLATILGLGRFTIADGRWSADGGAIEVVEAPAPDPNAVPPDQPVCDVTNPDGQLVDPNGGDGVAPPDAGSGSGGGSGASGGSGGGSAPGSAPASSGTEGSGVTEPDPGTGSGAPDAPPPADQPCANVVGNGVKVDPAPGVPVERTTPGAIVDTARDVLFIPLAIGFGLVLLVTAALLLRGRPTPR